MVFVPCEHPLFGLIFLGFFSFSDLCADILQIIQHVVKVVGSENSRKILSAVSPLLTFAGLVVRKSICDVLNALAKSDSSVLFVVRFIILTSFPIGFINILSNLQASFI